MTSERWRRLEQLFHDAHARVPADRAAFLAEACGDDAVLRDEIASLLADAGSDDDFLVAPALVLPPPSGLDADPSSMSGTTLGGYQLQALLGAGGMGEVYRAHDQRLGRDVAIKILPAAFTRHPDRVARLEREARMLAALNHPNICAIYGFEAADDIRLLVLELVEGDTLAALLAAQSRPDAAGYGLPIERVLAIARQIADALEVAHEKGIVHRDLKPANIKLTPDGIVKVLDFGLAKPIAREGSPDLSSDANDDGGRRPGAVIGTAAYMSPEQARGHVVDRRTDIWAFGCVVYEMVTGRVAFPGDTASDTIVRLLEHEPDWSALPSTTPAPLRRLLLRCLAKDAKKRLRDIGDARLELDASGDAQPEPAATATGAPAARGTAWLPWLIVGSLAVAAGVWLARRPAAPFDPLANATFSRVTNWEGTEEHAEISPDGRYAAFLADQRGELDIWVTQLGTGSFDNLTADLPGLATPGNLLRSLGFSGDGSEIWFNRTGNPGMEKVLVPLRGGTARPFLDKGHSTPSWSPDNARLAYIGSSEPGDPLSLADRTGADARPIVFPVQDRDAFVRKGVHTHNPAWSADGQWIYVTHGADPNGSMNVWRLRPSGATVEQLTHQKATVNYLAPIDPQTLLYVARGEDWSGPWLWALDLTSKATRRVTTGLERYTSVSASRDGRRIVATVANPTATLWSVPLLDRPIDERDAVPYDVPSTRALAPRFGGATLFYLSLSSAGTGDGLWRLQDGRAFEVRKGADGVLSEPPAVSPDGSRLAVVVRQQGKRRLAIMSADGTNARTLATSIELEGSAGQGTADWSPDGKWLATGGSNGQGPGLFKIPVDGGEPVRLVEGEARNPVWSPKGDLIVYAVPFGSAGGRDELRAVRPDGITIPMPEVRVRLGGAHRFLRSGTGLVYLPALETKDFWLVDLPSGSRRQLTHFANRGYLSSFDVTPDGRHLVFDRSRQNADIVLIELPAK